MTLQRNIVSLSRIDDTLYTLVGVRWFSTPDLKSGCFQVALNPVDKDKTAFSTGKGLWQLTIMPLGPYNALLTFERPMQSVLWVLTKSTWCTLVLLLWPYIPRPAWQPAQRVPEDPMSSLQLWPGKMPTFPEGVTALYSCTTGRSDYRPREPEGWMGVAVAEGQTQFEEFPCLCICHSVTYRQHHTTCWLTRDPPCHFDGQRILWRGQRTLEHRVSFSQKGSNDGV
jgi:hypothetical protein